MLNIAIVNHSHDVARCDLQIKTPRNGGRMLLKMCSAIDQRKICNYLKFNGQNSNLNVNRQNSNLNANGQNSNFKR